ncbi:MAG: transcriptional regulator [Methyloprofundus sp.]|nr:transcriptional regulator [Methyloprofundus sp.]
MSINNASAIEEQNKANASRILSQTLEAGLIKLYDPEAGVRAKRYIPIWA